MTYPRLPWTTLVPTPFRAAYALTQAIDHASIGMTLVELVRLRVSQINGCAYCVDMHGRGLRGCVGPGSGSVKVTVAEDYRVKSRAQHFILERCHAANAD